MNEGAPHELSATSKRMLGIRDFESIPTEQKAELLGSNERVAALASIDTTTMPRGPKREMKRGVVLELLKQQLLNTEILKSHPLIYIGSGVDIEYPLAIGGRHIIMVDPIFKEEGVVKEVITKIENLIVEGVSQDNRHLTFDFNFGDGKEEVVVELVPQAYDPAIESGGYEIPDSTGYIVLYASQGPSGVVSVSEGMKAKIVEGGAILHDADVMKIGENKQEENVSLGKSYS